MPKGSDRSWIEKLYDKCKKWEHFQKPRLSQTAFLVTHFADKVIFVFILFKGLLNFSFFRSSMNATDSCTKTETLWWRSS